jgi:hypothetical protein
MSDRPCNRCDYETRKREAKKRHKKLRLRADDGWLRVEVAEVGTNDWKDAEVLYKVVSRTCEC